MAAAVTAAIIAALGALGGTGLSVYGSNQASKKAAKSIKKNQMDTRNPLYNGILIDALTQMGIPVPPGLALQSSPLYGLRGINTQTTSQINDAIQAGIDAGLSDAEIAKNVEKIGQRTNKAGKVTKSTFYDRKGRIKNKYGFSSLEELVKNQRGFLENASVTGAANQETAQLTAQGRTDALRNIAKIQGDFVAPSQADILSQARIVEEAYRGQIARERGDQEAALLEQANTMNINPAARLGRLDEWQAQRNLEAQPEGLARALQLLSGQQGLQAGALSTLQSSLGQASGQGMNVLGLQNSLGQQAASQALALAGMQSQNYQNAGYGISTAANSISQIPMLQQLLEGGQRAVGPGDVQNMLDYDSNKYQNVLDKYLGPTGN